MFTTQLEHECEQINIRLDEAGVNASVVFLNEADGDITDAPGEYYLIFNMTAGREIYFASMKCNEKTTAQNVVDSIFDAFMEYLD